MKGVKGLSLRGLRGVVRRSLYTQRLPALGDSISSGTLNEWVVKPGDIVSTGQLLATVDTDKVSVDINAEAGGKITKFYATEAGQEIKVNQPLIDIDDSVEVEVAGSKSGKVNDKKEEKVESGFAVGSGSDEHGRNDDHHGESREPMIKFRHGFNASVFNNAKKLIQTKLNLTRETPETKSESPRKESPKESTTELENFLYGRLPPLSLEEVEHNNLGLS